MNKSEFISRASVEEIYNRPLFILMQQAIAAHKENFPAPKMHLNTLISYKTGGCGEDCAYCAQSSRHTNPAKAVYLSEEDILNEAHIALENGARRVCISASWRKVPENEEFEMILRAGQKIKEMGLEVCATLGTISENQLLRMHSSGFSAYNHNLDTGEKYYPKIISTRNYQERLTTLNTVQNTDVNCCSGGILGMGESHDDRIDFIHSLADRKKHLFTIPLNVLVPIAGTPLENCEPLPFFDFLRVLCSIRIIMPQSRICLAAGRSGMSDEQQTLCFLCGSNAVFAGEKLLTTVNSKIYQDKLLFDKLGINKDE